MHRPENRRHELATPLEMSGGTSILSSCAATKSPPSHMEKKEMSNLIRYYNPLDRAFDRALGVLLPSVNADSVSGGRAMG